MEKRTELSRLESRQLELLAEMASSDAHAAKCAKLGLSFAETYPHDLEQYKAAVSEYNENETRIAELRQEIADDEAAEAAARHDEMPDNENAE